MLRGIAFTLCITSVIVGAGCMKDLSGLARDKTGKFYSVNNRPGLVARCDIDMEKGKSRCKALPFELQTFENYDLEGIVWVNEKLFYVVSEKRENQCFEKCTLSQEILPFTINEQGRVVQAACSPMQIPLLPGDDPNCRAANCGLEGVTYDAEKNVLYVAKEHSEPRIFRIPLDEQQCPIGRYEELDVAKLFPAYSDLAFSAKRRTLFVLSSRGGGFVELDLATKRVLFSSDSILGVREFIKAHIPTEGILIDDEKDMVYMMAEDGAFFSMPLHKASSAANP